MTYSVLKHSRMPRLRKSLNNQKKTKISMFCEEFLEKIEELKDKIKNIKVKNQTTDFSLEINSQDYKLKFESNILEIKVEDNKKIETYSLQNRNFNEKDYELFFEIKRELMSNYAKENDYFISVNPKELLENIIKANKH